MAVKIIKRRFPDRIPGGVAFTDIRDVAAAVWACAELQSPRPLYHLPGEARTVREFFASIADLGGVKPPRFALPYRLAHTLAVATRPLSRWTGKNLMPVVVEMRRHYWGMTSKYADELNFSPRPAQQTLADTVQWLREHHPDVRQISARETPSS
jgi:dihydroflavonol-4-reductase